MMRPGSATPPTALGRRWVKYVVGFGVTAIVGMAPFLGEWNVPGFTPLLSLFPTLPVDTTTAVVPISALIMGMVGAVTQYLSNEEKLSPRALRWGFFVIAILVIVSAIAMLLVHPRVVVQRPVPAKDATVTVLVGFTRSHCDAMCAPEISNSECLGYTTLDPDRIEACWGEREIQLAGDVLALLYVVMTAGFGAMIGGLVLREHHRDPVEREEGASGA